MGAIGCAIMNKKPITPRDYRGLSLIQVRDDREAMLLKMRSKLAGAAEPPTLRPEKRRVAMRKPGFPWRWGFYAAALLGLCNYAYFDSGSENSVPVKEKRAKTLPLPPAKLSANDQALYWSYALYDFERLKEKFGVPKATIVDSRLAAEKLQALLPKVDAMTRFTIDRYTSEAGRVEWKK
ncbi:MAG: hypothetical protein JWO30_4559 [Fibrobacteres bacterium]|nr:hypothetical protein [Fibrobacterota bacterium]